MSTHHRLRRVVSGLSTGGYAIDNSMVLNDNDAQYLQRSNPGTPTSADIGTISVWFKRGNFPSGNNLRIWNHGDGGAPNIELLIFGSSNKMLVNGDAAGGTSNTTTQVFRDPHAWTNAVVRINTRESVASDRVRLYINGTLVSDYDSTSYPNQNGDIFQSTPDWWVGRWS
ncbi:LamG-like jellyroll fold domain-containing protein, partial [uncultured Alcanivorax sp.]|uniref:LamG-like jellyroll fold domain-containing protein n=1 Tax=uncultured Alcanivorax sp. TaxID=191215 RepID=UPI0030EE989D